MLDKLCLVLTILVVGAQATQDIDQDYGALRMIDPNESVGPTLVAADLTPLSKNPQFPPLPDTVTFNAERNRLHKRLPVPEEDFEMPLHTMITIDNEA